MPAGRHELVLLDMATAVMALGRIAQLKAAGKELPPGVALTADGEPTTDPALAKVPTPVGGAKGAGMSPGLRDAGQRPGRQPDRARATTPARKEGRRHRQNGFLLAIDVAAFLPLDEFTATIDDTVDAIKSLPPADGHRRGPRPRRAGPPHREADRARGRHPARPQGLARASRDRDHLDVPVPDPLS